MNKAVGCDRRASKASDTDPKAAPSAEAYAILLESPIGSRDSPAPTGKGGRSGTRGIIGTFIPSVL
ncbi:hypothetical protein DUHN55_40500 [Helicobacter pylori]